MSVSDRIRAIPDNVRRAAIPPPVYRGHQRTFLVIVLILACFAPLLFGGTRYSGGLLNSVMIHALLAFGFFWCFSLGGQFTFGVFAMYAAGAYFTNWAAGVFANYWLGLITGVVVVAVIGALTRLVFAKLSPIYFAIATMAVGGIMLIIFREWTSFTGGYNGISLSEKPELPGLTISTTTEKYYLFLVALAICLFLTILFLRSPAYRDLQMARDSGRVASTIGLRSGRIGLVAFTVGSAIQGLAGGLFAVNAGFFSLESFSIEISLSVLLMVLLGGAGSIYGPIIGAALLVYLPELLRDAAIWAEVIYAGLVLAIVVAFPGGIADVRRIVTKWVQRARSN